MIHSLAASLVLGLVTFGQFSPVHPPDSPDTGQVERSPSEGGVPTPPGANDSSSEMDKAALLDNEAPITDAYYDEASRGAENRRVKYLWVLARTASEPPFAQSQSALKLRIAGKGDFDCQKSDVLRSNGHITEMFVDLREVDVRTSDLVNGGLEFRTLGNDAWLPSYVWLIARVLGDGSSEFDLSIVNDSWPADLWLSTDANEGKTLQKLPAPRPLPRSGDVEKNIAGVWVLAATSSARHAGTGDPILLCVENDGCMAFPPRDESATTAQGRVARGYAASTWNRFTVRQFRGRGHYLSIDSDDEWLPSRVWLIVRTTRGSEYVEYNRAWPTNRWFCRRHDNTPPGAIVSRSHELAHYGNTPPDP